MTRLLDDTPRNLWRLAASFVLAAGLVGLWADCGEGQAGQVCELPDAADCPSHAGGEAGE